jgi:serine/threonine-protein kinase
VAHLEQLGKYRIMGVLGEGAMGVVYRGFDPDIRRVVALKTIRRSTGEGMESAAQSAARFRNEAQAAGRLMHPGIVGVYDFGEVGDGADRIAYIAMEYVEGHTLSAYLGQKLRFDALDTASIVTQLLEGLGHAHDNQVWHRDIKPSNVIMTRTGRVKIADFGIARTDETGMTLAGGVLGTPMYMAPEQFLGQAIDHRADLYGAGVVLYQLIAGRPPFVGTAESLSYRVVHEAPQAPSTVAGAANDPRFDAVALKALAKQPTQRFAHAEAFRDALLAALGQGAPSTVSAAAVAALPPQDGFEITQRIPPPPSSLPQTGSAIAHFDPAVLALLEASLVKHVGPMAGTMVRRAARDCADLPALQARLAEQITQVSVREAFLAQLRRAGTGTHAPVPGPSTGSTAGSVAGSHRLAPTAPPAPRAPATSGTRAGPPVSDAWLEQAQRILAAQLGPIARVVLKRAAERTRQRDALCALLLEAAPEGARARLQADLARLA